MKLHSAVLILSLAAGLAACSPSTTETGKMQEEPGLANGSFTAELNGFKIHYEIHGDGPVVMVVPNSWGLDTKGLRGVYGALEAHLTMVYFDPRGMGESEPVREPADMGLEAVRADFDALRAHLDLETVHAIGWSNGAMNLVLLASERPEILESAIFLHGAASYTPQDYAMVAEKHPEVAQAFMALQQELQDPEWTVDRKTERMHQVWIETFFPASCADPETMIPVLRRVFTVDSFSWPHADYTNRSYPTFDARDELDAITVRSLIISGVHDTMPPGKGEEMRDGIAGSELVVFENSGHFAPLEEPDRFARVVLDFLGEQ